MTSTTELPVRDEPRGSGGRTVLILSVVVALALGGIAGIAIGWKLEQRRVEEDIKNIRPAGRVTAVDGDSVTIKLVTSSGTRTYTLTDRTVIDSAKAGTSADVVNGATVLVKSGRGSDGTLEASEIIVLPKSTTFGAGG